MSLIRPASLLFALLATLNVLCGTAHSQPATYTNSVVTAKVRVNNFGLMFVPITINGSGPYEFLLDTGTSRSIVDRKLAEELGLDQVGAVKVHGTTTTTTMPLVHAQTIAVGSASVAEMTVASGDRTSLTPVGASGILGEDFLRNFDVLIDNQRRTVQLGTPDDALSKNWKGEHVPLVPVGQMDDHISLNRLIVSARVLDMGGHPMLVSIDSGANQLVIFRDTLEVNFNQRSRVRLTSLGSEEEKSMQMRSINSMRFGKHELSAITAVTMPHPAGIEVDGLLPTGLFNSIFISHRGGFVIFDPKPVR